MEKYSTQDQAISVVAAIIYNESKLLVTRRFGDSHLGNLWEFPGGKVKRGELMEAALTREIQEELGVQIKVGSLILDERFHYHDRTIHLHFFDCWILKGDPHPLGVAELAWVFPAELGQYAMPKANSRLIARLQER